MCCCYALFSLVSRLISLPAEKLDWTHWAAADKRDPWLLCRSLTSEIVPLCAFEIKTTMNVNSTFASQKFDSTEISKVHYRE